MFDTYDAIFKTKCCSSTTLGGAVSEVTLAVATANLNSRIRSRGLSSREMWSQRDQFSNRQLPMSDEDLITTQHDQRLIIHPHSMKSKAPLALPRPTPDTEVGDLVYIHSDSGTPHVTMITLQTSERDWSSPYCVPDIHYGHLVPSPVGSPLCP